VNLITSVISGGLSTVVAVVGGFSCTFFFGSFGFLGSSFKARETKQISKYGTEQRGT
jgi:hypothetical protein